MFEHAQAAMGAKQKEGKQMASQNGSAAQAENGVTDTVTIANGQKVGATIHCLQVPEMLALYRVAQYMPVSDNLRHILPLLGPQNALSCCRYLSPSLPTWIQLWRSKS